MAERTPAAPSRLLVAAALIVSLVLLAGGALTWLLLQPPGESPLAHAIGGPFQLVDQDGRTVTDTDLRGKWLLVYFGYTHCPDACPTALNDIALALRALGPRASAVRPVFITVDPKRDTPAVLKEYVKSFGAPILALTGSEAAVAQAARDYRVYYARHDLPGGDYEMDHSSIIYLMDPQGRFAASLTETSSPTPIADALKKRLG
jgi:protein SCO1/2